MKAGRIAEALDVMSAHQLSDFPPGWEPPPRIGLSEESPHILDVLDVLVTREVAPWVRAEYVDKFQRYLGDFDRPFYGSDRSLRLAQCVRIFRRLPDGPILAERVWRSNASQFRDEQPSAEDRANLDALFELTRKNEPKP
jgi:hypothetical protein